MIENETSGSATSREKNGRSQSEHKSHKSEGGEGLSLRSSKEPYQIDYLKRAKSDYSESEMSEDQISIEECDEGEPVEVIFADLQSGSYFGELGLTLEDKAR